MIINNGLHDYKDKSKRKFRYNFNDLEAIIFGIKTSAADKIRILKIIDEKCKKYGRKEFDFFQAYYSRHSGKIETYKLSLLKTGANA